MMKRKTLIGKDEFATLKGAEEEEEEKEIPASPVSATFVDDAIEKSFGSFENTLFNKRYF